MHSHRVFSDRVARRLDQGTLRCELVHNAAACWREKAPCNTVPVRRRQVREVEGREVNTILSLATAIEADWLRELYPEDMESDLHVQFDSTARRVQASE